MYGGSDCDRQAPSSRLTWLFAPLPTELGVPLRVFLECALGGIFAALFVRRLGLDGFAAALGGLLYAVTCLLGQSFWPPVISTLLWLPAQLACVEALAQRWRWRSWLALVACTALQWLSGFPQFAFYGLHLVLPFAVLRSLTHQGFGNPGLRRLAGIGAALALGLGVAGAQLLPSAELVAHSARSGALGIDDIHYLGNASSAATALRNALDPSPRLLAFDFGGGGNYLGIATLLLLGIGVLYGPRGLVALLLGVGALALLLSDGFNGPGAPVYRLYAALPGVGAFRTPERLRILTLLGVIVVACIGLDRLGRGFAGVSRLRKVATALFILLAALAIVMVSHDGVRTGLACALVLAAIFERQVRVRPIAQALLVACVLFDLLLATAPYGSFRRMPLEWSDRFTLSGYTILDAAGLERLRASAGRARRRGGEALPRPAAARCSAPIISRASSRWPPRSWRAAAARVSAPRSGRPLYDVASVCVLVRPLRRDPARPRGSTRRSSSASCSACPCCPARRPASRCARSGGRARCRAPTGSAATPCAAKRRRSCTCAAGTSTSTARCCSTATRGLHPPSARRLDRAPRASSRRLPSRSRSRSRLPRKACWC